MSGMANVPDLPDQPPALRASDADRERVAEILRTAATEGRLDLDELDERLAAVYRAKTYADLVPLTRDLPVAPAAAPVMPASADRFGGGTPATGGLGAIGGVSRQGPL